MLTLNKKLRGRMMNSHICERLKHFSLVKVENLSFYSWDKYFHKNLKAKELFRKAWRAKETHLKTSFKNEFSRSWLWTNPLTTGKTKQLGKKLGKNTEQCQGMDLICLIWLAENLLSTAWQTRERKCVSHMCNLWDKLRKLSKST